MIKQYHIKYSEKIFQGFRKYAKTFEGFKTSTLGKITALTLVQYVNSFIFDRPINNIKDQTF
mgnify:CR=1 FL=1|tara:strand:- start:9494 stop:9679 length:186 start_codon:yes stop_codon:yes gene_type:complete